MATLELLDTTRTARILGDLESKLRSLVVTQDEAIHEIVTAIGPLSETSRPVHAAIGTSRAGAITGVCHPPHGTIDWLASDGPHVPGSYSYTGVFARSTG